MTTRRKSEQPEQPQPDEARSEPVAPAAAATAAAPAVKLSSEEEAVVRTWLAYGPGSDPNAVSAAGQLLTRRGKLYYNPAPDDAEQRVCIGATLPRGGRGFKTAYTGHRMAPQELQEAVAAYAERTDSAVRYHQ